MTAARAAIEIDAQLPGWSNDDIGQLTEALLRASDVLIDELFFDCVVLEGSPLSEPLPLHSTLQVVSLPECYSSRYNAYLVHKLLLSAGSMTTRFISGWRGPDTVAECLLLDLLVENVAQWVEGQELDLPSDWPAGLERALYLDFDHQVLYERSSWVGVPKRFTFERWFDSFRDEPHPPYVVLP